MCQASFISHLFSDGFPPLTFLCSSLFFSSHILSLMLLSTTSFDFACGSALSPIRFPLAKLSQAGEGNSNPNSRRRACESERVFVSICKLCKSFTEKCRSEQICHVNEATLTPRDTHFCHFTDTYCMICTKRCLERLSAESFNLREVRLMHCLLTGKISPKLSCQDAVR